MVSYGLIMEIEDFKKLLVIDKGNLDDDVARQAQIFFQVCEAHVEAIAERDACKEELATTDAELDYQVRRDLSQSEEKVTEAMVKNCIQCHKDHQAAFDTYTRAKMKADLLAGLKDSFAQRSDALKDMVKLFLASYFETTTISANQLDKAKYEARRNQMAEGRRERIRNG